MRRPLCCRPSRSYPAASSYPLSARWFRVWATCPGAVYLLSTILFMGARTSLGRPAGRPSRRWLAGTRADVGLASRAGLEPGREYCGRSTYLAEQPRAVKRGYATSWIIPRRPWASSCRSPSIALCAPDGLQGVFRRLGLAASRSCSLILLIFSVYIPQAERFASLRPDEGRRGGQGLEFPADLRQNKGQLPFAFQQPALSCSLGWARPRAGRGLYHRAVSTPCFFLPSR